MTPKGHDMFANYSNYINNLRSLGNRCFTFKQVLNDLKVSIDSAKAGLYRLKKDGKLITPAKGLYVIVPPEHQPYGSIPAEDLVPILMNYFKAEYYVSLLSAAQYYGASHQKPGCFQVISNKRIKHNLEFGQVKIKLIYKTSITGLPVKDIAVSTGYLKIATPELVAFDLLNYRNQSGGLNHIATVLSELIEAIDEKKLIELANKLKEKSWVQRLGYILEQIETMDEKKTKNIIGILQQHLSGKTKFFIPLASEIATVESPRVKKWMIIANTNIESDL